jgi:hypothetical protein
MKPKSTKAPESAKPTSTTAPASEPGTVIQHCSFVNTSAANEHTRYAVEALAAAAKANADAITAIANCLKGSPATMGVGTRIHLQG